MFVPEFFQYGRIGRISRLCLFNDRKLQFFKQNLAQLFGRIDIEHFAGIVIDGLFQFIRFQGQFPFHLLQPHFIDGKAIHFHDSQRMDERFFDGPV